MSRMSFQIGGIHGIYYIKFTKWMIRRPSSHCPTSPYGGPVSKAPMAVVFLGDESRMTVPMMWEQDMGACVENFMVAATSIGLGTVWIGIAPLQDRMDAISDLLSVPEGFKPFCIVAIGHPKEPLAPKPVRYDPARIHRNSF